MNLPNEISTEVALPYDGAVAKIREALAREGFGIISEIDMKKTLREKLDAEFRPYVILGACLPTAAKATLEVDPRMGLFMPCNVCVFSEGADRTRIVAFDPLPLLEQFGGSGPMAPVIRDVSERLHRALAAAG